MAVSLFSDPFFGSADPFFDPFIGLAAAGAFSGGGGGPPGGSGGNWDGCRRIRIDLAEQDDKYELYADIPGETKDAIKLEVEGDMLNIKVDKPEVEPEATKFLRGERVTGYRPRRVRLPPNADLETLTAKYENGVLMVDIPKRKDAEAKQITIQ